VDVSEDVLRRRRTKRILLITNYFRIYVFTTLHTWLVFHTSYQENGIQIIREKLIFGSFFRQVKFGILSRCGHFFIPYKVQRATALSTEPSFVTQLGNGDGFNQDVVWVGYSKYNV